MWSKNSISWQDWADSPSESKATRYSRKRVLQLWSKANGSDSPTVVLDTIFSDQVTPYTTANKFLNQLRDEEYAPATVAQYRSMLVGEGKKGHGAGFFLAVLGEENFSTRVFDRLVPAGDNYTLIEKKAPTPEELRHILRNLANPRDRALLGFLASSAMRIGEAVSRKMSEIERRKDGHATITLRAGSTKKRYVRYVYLTKEVVDWIDAYHTGLQPSTVGHKDKDHGNRKPINGVGSEWIFPGETDTEHKGRRGAKGEQGHLDKVSGYKAIKDLFIRAGLTDKSRPNDKGEQEGYIYSPHSMRKFAENQMVRVGLGDKFVRLITGHTNATERAYCDWEEIEAQWMEKCSEKMTWLTETVTVIKPDPEMEKKVKFLEEQLQTKASGQDGFYRALSAWLRKKSVVIELDEKGLPSKFVDRKQLPQYYGDESGETGVGGQNK